MMSEPNAARKPCQLSNMYAESREMSKCGSKDRSESVWTSNPRFQRSLVAQSSCYGYIMVQRMARVWEGGSTYTLATLRERGTVRLLVYYYSSKVESRRNVHDLCNDSKIRSEYSDARSSNTPCSSNATPGTPVRFGRSR